MLRRLWDKVIRAPAPAHPPRVRHCVEGAWVCDGAHAPSAPCAYRAPTDDEAARHRHARVSFK